VIHPRLDLLPSKLWSQMRLGESEVRRSKRRERMSDELESPAVFLSHATEDNDRFARGFAKKLQEKGLRVWFDEWELLPGDSLVDKIFEEGLKDAEAMVIILSGNSVKKPWVREEINAAFVKRVQGQCKLIPVILDGVAVPEALASTVYQPIGDLDSYETELDRIVRAIIGDRKRLAASDPPAYAQIAALPGLYSTDTVVLRHAGAKAIEADETLLGSTAVLAELRDEDVTEEAFLESLQVLDERGYVKVHRTLGSGILSMGHFTITTLGMQEYARAFLPSYAELLEDVVAQLVNGERVTDRQIAGEIDVPRILVEHVFDVLQSRGLIKLSKTTGPNSHVIQVSPQLARMLQGA
jgi:hypothetical protein